MPDVRRTRWSSEAQGRAPTYDQRWAEMAARGENVHGEADLVESLAPASVLDAGCGTGRVAIELARRGIEVVGVDLDPAMLDLARAKAPDVPWIEGDLATVDVGRRFDLVVLAGNVMIFLEPGTEAAVVANMARHLLPGGALVAGFQLDTATPFGQTTGHIDLATYDRHAAAAGLGLDRRWATWDRQPFDGPAWGWGPHAREEGGVGAPPGSRRSRPTSIGGNYAVSVHRAPG